jgi:hypothetical protein
MAFSALGIIERGYRGSVETQFADVLYLARELNRQLGRLDIALRGLAVTYAVATDFEPHLDLAGRRLAGLPDARASIQTLLGDGVTVTVDAGDLRALGLGPDRLLPGVRWEEPEAAARRWADYDAVWFL